MNHSAHEEEEDESEDDESLLNPQPPPALMKRLERLAAEKRLAGASDSDDSEGAEHEESASTHDSKGAGGVVAGGTDDKGGEASVAEEDGDVLPSATDVLFDGGGPKPAFLRVTGPDFDASALFKPPPVGHADLMGSGSYHPHDPARRSLDSEAPEQRYHPEDNHGLAQGQVRLRGSVCRETDDERGRRVVYGAHQMLKADPWSQCNPNMPFKSGASGKRRRPE